MHRDGCDNCEPDPGRKGSRLSLVPFTSRDFRLVFPKTRGAYKEILQKRGVGMASNAPPWYVRWKWKMGCKWVQGLVVGISPAPSLSSLFPLVRQRCLAAPLDLQRIRSKASSGCLKLRTVASPICSPVSVRAEVASLATPACAQ